MYIRFLVVLLLAGAGILYAASDEAQVYFNAGTEKYLQGRFSEAVDDLQKAQQLDPTNTKIKGFMSKILLEAATQNHLNRKYAIAMDYVTKARAIDPGNQKVEEMYRLTSELLGKSGAGTDAAVHGVSAQKIKIPALPSKGPAGNQGQTDNSMTAAQPQRKEIHRTAPPVTRSSVEKTPPANAGSFSIQLKKSTVLLIVSSAGAGIFFLLFLMKSTRLAGAQAKLRSVNDTIALLESDKQVLVIENEKMKERLKYEHQAAEQSRQDLREKNRRDEERFKAELDLRTRQAEERIRAELAAPHQRREADDPFLHQQQAKFLEYVDDSSGIDDTSSPVLESTRERIGMMAENLYAYAPGAATDFLQKMAANANPLIRTNVIRALARIARPETLDMLFALYGDPDPRVKREVLKTMKQLNLRIAGGEVNVSADVAGRITGLIQEEKKKGEWII